jgi:hypothetical protein
MNASWKAKHVVAIVAVLAAAGVIGPVAVQASLTTQPVTIYDWTGTDSASIVGNGSLSVTDQSSSGDALNYLHATLTAAAPSVVLGAYPDETTSWQVTAIGVTSLPAAKGPSYVEFKHVSIQPGATCQVSQPPAEVFLVTSLPSLWVQPKNQTEYPFSPRIAFDIGRHHCMIATLISGGPVDAHMTAFGLEANF